MPPSPALVLLSNLALSVALPLNIDFLHVQRMNILYVLLVCIPFGVTLISIFLGPCITRKWGWWCCSSQDANDITNWDCCIQVVYTLFSLHRLIDCGVLDRCQYTITVDQLPPVSSLIPQIPWVLLRLKKCRERWVNCMEISLRMPCGLSANGCIRDRHQCSWCGTAGVS